MSFVGYNLKVISGRNNVDYKNDKVLIVNHLELSKYWYIYQGHICFLLHVIAMCNPPGPLARLFKKLDNWLSTWLLSSAGISMTCLTMAPRHRSNVLRHRQMTHTIVKLSSAIVQTSSFFVAWHHFFLSIIIKCM